MPEPRGRAATRRRRVMAPTSLLAVDVGNSETTVGRFVGRDLESFWRLTSGRHTADELRYILEALLKVPAAGWGSIICSVVPAQTTPWREALRTVTGRAPFEVTAETTKLPVR